MTDHLVCISRRGVDPGHRGPELLLIAGELPLGTVKHIILDCLSCPASKARCGLADAMANRVYLNYTKQAMPMQEFIM